MRGAEAAEPPRDPGAALREAREARSLAMEEVANRLRLDCSIVAALEANDHRQLPAPLYVRGYLRSYAALLELDAAPLLGAYDRLHPHAGALHPVDRHRRQLASGDRRVYVVTLAIIVGIGVLLFFAWRQEQGYREAGINDELAPLLTETPTEAVPAPGDAAADEVTAPAPVQGFDYTFPVIFHDPAQAPADWTQPPEAAPAAAFPDGGRLVLRLSGESWLEVRDAAGRNLLTRLGQPGDRYTLDGEAPFLVLIGNVQAVASLRYEGEEWDLAAHTRGNVARITLGE